MCIKRELLLWCRPVQRMQRKGGKGESVCAICDGAVPRKNSLSTLIAPCCSAFLHKDCIQVGNWICGGFQ